MPQDNFTNDDDLYELPSDLTMDELDTPPEEYEGHFDDASLYSDDDDIGVDEDEEGADDFDMATLLAILDRAIGYGTDGQPLSITQFTFGSNPLVYAQGEALEEVVKLTEAFQADVPVNLEIMDEVAVLSFDFVSNLDQMRELYDILMDHKAQYDHVNHVVHTITEEMQEANAQGDARRLEEGTIKLRAVEVPFMYPTIIPKQDGGTVYITFSNFPRFIYTVAEGVDNYPTKIVLVYQLDDIEYSLNNEPMEGLDEDMDEVMDAMDAVGPDYDEMAMMQEMKKYEEEQYFAQRRAEEEDYDDDDYEDPISARRHRRR